MTALQDISQNPWRLLTFAALLAITLLAAACSPATETSPPSTATPQSPQPTETPLSLPAGSEPDPWLVDRLPSQYLRFDRLTTEDGLPNDQVWDVVQDNDGFMWFATVDGLSRYDGNSFKVFRHDVSNPSSLSQSYTLDLLLDHSGALWVGTWDSGLNQYSRETERFIRYRHDPDNPQSLSNNSVRSIYEDRAGTIWVGTLGGLNKLDLESGQFAHYRHSPDDPHSLSHDTVWTIFEDGNGIMWVGTAGGLDYFDPGTETFIHYRHDPDDPQSLSHNTIRSIYEDRTGTLWMGTLLGLNRFNRETEQFTHYQHDASDPQSLSNDYVFSISEDHADGLWVATRGGGLNRFDPETEAFTHYQHDLLSFLAQLFLPDTTLILAASFVTGMLFTVHWVAAAPFFMRNAEAEPPDGAVRLRLGARDLGDGLERLRRRVLARPASLRALGSELLGLRYALAGRPRSRFSRSFPSRASAASRRSRSGAAWRSYILARDFKLLGKLTLPTFLVGCGAGLTIPFLNLYFRSRFDQDPQRIGIFFAVAQVLDDGRLPRGTDAGPPVQPRARRSSPPSCSRSPSS